MKKDQLLNIIHLYYVENDYKITEHLAVTKIKRPEFSDHFLSAIISYLVSLKVHFFINSDVMGTPQLVIKSTFL